VYWALCGKMAASTVRHEVLIAAQPDKKLDMQT